MKLMTRYLSLFLLTLPVAIATAAPAQMQDTHVAWVEAMKLSPRGPFKRISWFCNDGSVLEPEPYACVEHEGGIQHGEWTEKTARLRAAGYLLANILAVYGIEDKPGPWIGKADLKQILLERFLTAYDDGWIFRKARYYRGAMQHEDEVRGAEALIRKFLDLAESGNQDYLLLWEAVRLLPGEGDVVSSSLVRDSSTQLAEKDPGFEFLRAKLHGQPEFADAARVRDYAARQDRKALQTELETLAASVETLFTPQPVAVQLASLADHLRSGSLKAALGLGVASWGDSPSAQTRLREGGYLLAAIRERLRAEPSGPRRVQVLRSAQNIEREVFTAGSELLGRLSRASRQERLAWLYFSARSIYGCGLISKREWQALRDSLKRLERDPLSLADYRQELRYLNRLPGWASRWLKFHFQQSMQHFTQIEPLSTQFIPARLRGSPVLFFNKVLDSLMRDADRLTGMNNRLFGEPVGSGLRALNPGLTRGVLKEAAADRSLQPDGIYLLPATTAELTPVAGILTMGEGNALSHVQLLAANLGIPNVVVDQSLLALLRAWMGQGVVFAVSPGGVVQLSRDDPGWGSIFKQKQQTTAGKIEPDLNKLDLEFLEIIDLSRLRATDSGRIVGPKAANLGELKNRFPNAVAAGLVIPFGRFRVFLEQAMNETGETVMQWMRRQFRYLDTLQGSEREAASGLFLAELREWIEHADPGKDFRRDLARILEQKFGEDGSYALFVRSDTNVEDLPGFTGAGLNLTVPNVVGFDALIEAVIRVWASPFAERAYRWRQQRMSAPEHVYPSILLLQTVLVDKSGVLLTMDTETGSGDWFSVAVNHGIGGAVQGQAAEELKIHKTKKIIRVLADSANPEMNIVDRQGGLKKTPVDASGKVLTKTEIDKLKLLVKKIQRDFPQLDDQGNSTPADVEYGFKNGELVLFQIRPYMQSRNARKNRFLQLLDGQRKGRQEMRVDLAKIPESE